MEISFRALGQVMSGIVGLSATSVPPSVAPPSIDRTAAARAAETRTPAGTSVFRAQKDPEAPYRKSATSTPHTFEELLLAVKDTNLELGDRCKAATGYIGMLNDLYSLRLRDGENLPTFRNAVVALLSFLKTASYLNSEEPVIRAFFSVKLAVDHVPSDVFTVNDLELFHQAVSALGKGFIRPSMAVVDNAVPLPEKTILYQDVDKMTICHDQNQSSRRWLSYLFDHTVEHVVCANKRERKLKEDLQRGFAYPHQTTLLQSLGNISFAGGATVSVIALGAGAVLSLTPLIYVAAAGIGVVSVIGVPLKLMDRGPRYVPYKGE